MLASRNNRRPQDRQSQTKLFVRAISAFHSTVRQVN